jgi:hypothetical protein
MFSGFFPTTSFLAGKITDKVIFFWGGDQFWGEREKLALGKKSWF